MTVQLKILKIVCGSIFSLVGLFLIYDANTPVDKNEYDKNESELTTIKTTLLLKPYYKKRGGKSGSSSLKLYLDGYPRINIENENDFLKATDFENAVKELNEGDTVSIKVLKTDYEERYIKEESISDLRKIANPGLGRLRFYSLVSNGKEYVNNLLEVAKTQKADKQLLQSFFGLIFIGMGIYFFVTKK
jgi:hypothetical protein